MSTMFRLAPPPRHPDEFFTPGWDAESNRPVVDGKYHEPKTGELRPAIGRQFAGPPAVDIIITNLHEESCGRVYRAQLPFRVERLLVWIMGVVEDRKLQLDSLNATPYAIRVVLAHELTGGEFTEVASTMAKGILYLEGPVKRDDVVA
ncbi:hypothetical protein AbraIFM66950_007968 [Aspergillus brasiliensis]|nr:hypothetical protein AbraIFM66950_007968 [Aspergillus brasiliensis]